jgi:hypothetical protein
VDFCGIHLKKKNEPPYCAFTQNKQKAKGLLSYARLKNRQGQNLKLFWQIVLTCATWGMDYS